ncbi:MAG: hypothetical protein HY401_02680 [Elusimicrobia bacterium]|nr:hypothetical protein [Elusimicrobiota bacterium]
MKQVFRIWNLRFGDKGKVIFALALLLNPISYILNPLMAGGILNFVPSDFDSGSFQDAAVDFQGKLTTVSRWDILTSTVPVRYYSAIAFDETRNRAAVFGGLDPASQPLGDTWVWNAVDGLWHQKTPPGPPVARYGHAMAWIGNKILFFGGAISSDTWSYDVASDSWGYVSSQVSPPAGLFLPAMAWDRGRNQALLFGGGQGNTTWIFDVGASSWSGYNISGSPSDRTGAVLAYDQTGQKFALVGGKLPGSSTYLDEIWAFDPVGFQWSQANPPVKPAARGEGAAAYDLRNKRMVMFGGWTGNVATSNGDTDYYDAPVSSWATRVGSHDNTGPTARFGHAMTYDTYNQRVLAFGGKLTDSSLVSSLWSRILRSSGSAITNYKNVSGTTPISWSTLNAGFFERPEKTDILLRIAASTDGATFDSFRGPDGSTSTFYSSSSTPLALWSGLANKRYLKIETNFVSENPPYRARLSGFDLTYNQAPPAPVLSSPADGSRINVSSPAFSWVKPWDPDGFSDEPFAYQLQVATSADFAAPVVSEENLSAVSLTISTELATGLWYWRVRAKDNPGLYGNYSSTFSVFVDTITPPSAVTQMTAAMGAGNGQIDLNWVFPGDDKGAVSGGRWRARYRASGAIASEADWSALAAVETSGLLTATSGQSLVTAIGSLEPATSYYFALKTEDELGNLSGLSTVSPFAMTNGSPAVTLTSHNNGGILINQTTITWTWGDPNAGDSVVFSLWLSSNSGAAFTQLIANGIAAPTSFYAWDTRSVGNASTYRIRARASDARNLWAQDESEADFGTDNVNVAPAISLTSAPAAGQKIKGKFTAAWNTTDPNVYQEHPADVFISPDNGTTWLQAVAGVTASSITLDTFSFWLIWGLNTKTTYRVRVRVTDTGIPPLSAEASSSAFEAVTRDQVPLALVKPLENDFPGVFDLIFQWTRPSDAVGSVVYTLHYSTDLFLAEGLTEMAGITALSWTPALGALAVDATYYWQIRSRDDFGKENTSDIAKFILSRNKVKSADGRLTVEALSGLPAGGFIRVREPEQAKSSLIDLANRDFYKDRLVRVLSSEPSRQIEVHDLAGNKLDASGVIARVSFIYTDANADGRLDAELVDASSLKVVHLDESQARWVALAAPVVDKSQKTISAQTNGFSLFALIAAATPAGLISGLMNYPNPFAAGRESTRLRYVLKENATVTIRIFTLIGDHVRTMKFDAGGQGGTGSSSGTANEVIWDGTNGDGVIAANGMYLAEITAEGPSGAEKHKRLIGVVK